MCVRIFARVPTEIQPVLSLIKVNNTVKWKNTESYNNIIVMEKEQSCTFYLRLHRCIVPPCHCSSKSNEAEFVWVNVTLRNSRPYLIEKLCHLSFKTIILCLPAHRMGQLSMEVQ